MIWDGEALSYLHQHEPLIFWVFLLMGGLNGLASALEYLCSLLPEGLPGWRGGLISAFRVTARIIQYFIQGLLAKRFKCPEGKKETSG